MFILLRNSFAIVAARSKDATYSMLIDGNILWLPKVQRFYLLK